MKSAYHQVPINEGDKSYTAFEADHGLYQFKRIRVGVMNGVATFQRIMDDITRENLSSTFAYLNNVFVVKLKLNMIKIWINSWTLQIPGI